MLTGGASSCQANKNISVASRLRPVAIGQDFSRAAAERLKSLGTRRTRLMERGIRLTSQRRAILQIVEMATKHLDASHIFQRRGNSMLPWTGARSTAL